MLIPFISDFWNMRAQQSQQSSSLLLASQILLPSALAGILGVTDAMTRLFAPIPTLVPFLTAVPILAVKVGCGIVVSRRRFATTAPEYFYTELLRRSAKFVFVPLLAISLISVWPYVPNAVAGRKPLGGFICAADTGRAIPISRVQVLDSAKTTISENDALTDSIGFCYVDKVSGFATKPAYLRLINADCRPEEVAISSAIRTASSQACPADPSREQPLGVWPVWSTICTKR